MFENEVGLLAKGKQLHLKKKGGIENEHSFFIVSSDAETLFWRVVFVGKEEWEEWDDHLI